MKKLIQTTKLLCNNLDPQRNYHLNEDYLASIDLSYGKI